MLSNMGRAFSALPANPPLLGPDFLRASAVEGKGLPGWEPHCHPYQVIQLCDKP